MLGCQEFVNADEIARGISPFNPESASIQAGRLMLERINYLMENDKDFAIETTLSTKSYKNLVLHAKENGYYVSLLFFWLSSPELAVKRVETRVKEGGHDIDEIIIRRRYRKGITNFFKIFEAIVDEWIFIDNSGNPYEIIAHRQDEFKSVKNTMVWDELINKYK